MSLDENPWATQSPRKSTGMPKRLGGDPLPLSKRMSEKFDKTKEAASAGMEKTKEAASTGMKKMKEGASSASNWFKVKYNKHKLFQKK